MEVNIRCLINNKSIRIRVDPNDHLEDLASDFKKSVGLSSSHQVTFLHNGKWISRGKQTLRMITGSITSSSITLDIVKKSDFFVKELEVKQSNQSELPHPPGLVDKKLVVESKIDDSLRSSKENLFISWEFYDKLDGLQEYFNTSKDRTNKYINGIIQKNQRSNHLRDDVPFSFF